MTGREAGSWEVKAGLGTKHGMLQVQSERKGLEGCRGDSENPRLDGEQKLGLAEASGPLSRGPLHAAVIPFPCGVLISGSGKSVLPLPPPPRGSAEHCQALPAVWVFYLLIGKVQTK